MTTTATPAQAEFIRSLVSELAELGAPAEALAAYNTEAMTGRQASAAIRTLKMIRDGARATARRRARGGVN